MFFFLWILAQKSVERGATQERQIEKKINTWNQISEGNEETIRIILARSKAGKRRRRRRRTESPVQYSFTSRAHAHTHASPQKRIKHHTQKKTSFRVKRTLVGGSFLTQEKDEQQ